MRVKLPKIVIKDNEAYYLSLNYTPVYANNDKLVWHWWAEYYTNIEDKKYLDIPFNGETYVNLGKYEMKLLDFLNTEKQNKRIYFDE